MMSKTTSTVQSIDESRVLYLSSFTDTQEAIGYISSLALSSWFTILDERGCTATCSQNSRNVTLSNVGLKTLGILTAGCQISFDGGIEWFNIQTVTSDTAIVMRSPLETASVSGVAITIARPNWRRFILDDAAKLTTLQFANGSTTNLQIINSCGGVLGNPQESAGLDRILYAPLYGNLMLQDVKSNCEGFETYGSTSWCAGGRNSSGEVVLGSHNRTLHYEEIGGRHISDGVDCFYPGGAFGSLQLNKSFYQSCQDIILPIHSGDLKLDSTVVRGLVRELSGLYLHIRTFTKHPSSVKNSTIVIDHNGATPLSPSLVLQINDSAAESLAQNKVSVWENSTIQYMRGAATDFDFIAGSSLATTGISCTINTCTFDGAQATGGIPEIVNTAAYTGTGSLTMNSPTKTNFVNGGGGTFTITG